MNTESDAERNPARKPPLFYQVRNNEGVSGHIVTVCDGM